MLTAALGERDLGMPPRYNCALQPSTGQLLVRASQQPMKDTANLLTDEKTTKGKERFELMLKCCSAHKNRLFDDQALDMALKRLATSKLAAC